MRMLAALRPRGSFRVTTEGGRTVIDPASYARYDGIADAVTSMDAAGGAKIYGMLKPRLEEAYASLGIADSSMDAALEGAIVKLLSTPVPDDPIEVQATGGVYAYASPALEQLSSAAEAADSHRARQRAEDPGASARNRAGARDPGRQVAGT